MTRSPLAPDLNAPVGTIMRPTLTVETMDSLARAAQLFRENGTTVLPVVDERGVLQGVVDNGALARALAEMDESTDSVGPFAMTALTIPPYATAAEALRQCEDGMTRVVIDDVGRVVGVISAVDLWPRRRVPVKPTTVGGMATPFGVYLTTGVVSAGAPWWALMFTGASMFGMLLAGTLLAGYATTFGLPAELVYGVTLALFLLFMRLSPLSGTHGAEHQVVHAIEREEVLNPATVRRMPRVHPRCGTNLAAALFLFLALALSDWGLYPQTTVRQVREAIGAQALPAAIATILFALPLGSFLQKYVTTKRPSERQLAGAIRAGEELLRRHSSAHRAKPTIPQRLWNMGMLQVMAGATATALLISLIRRVFHISWLPDLMEN